MKIQIIFAGNYSDSRVLIKFPKQQNEQFWVGPITRKAPPKFRRKIVKTKNGLNFATYEICPE